MNPILVLRWFHKHSSYMYKTHRLRTGIDHINFLRGDRTRDTSRLVDLVWWPDPFAIRGDKQIKKRLSILNKKSAMTIDLDSFHTWLQ